MEEPLDPETYFKINVTMSGARAGGRDPIEALNRAGLLLTPAKAVALKTEGVEFIFRQIVSWRPAEFLRRKFNPSHSASPTDMYSCIVEFIEANIAALKESK